MLEKNREIVLDLETTGLYHQEGDRIIEIGCVELLNHTPTGKTLQIYLNPKTKYVNEEARAIHGINNDFLKKQPTFKDKANDILDFIKNDTLVIHNATFDLGFLNKELSLCNLQSLSNPCVDTLLLARKKLGSGPLKLDSLCKRFNINTSKREFHGALLDSTLLAQVYIELLGGKQTDLGLFDKKALFVDKKTKHNTNRQLKKMILAKVSEEEIRIHKNFVKTLKKPIWNSFIY